MHLRIFVGTYKISYLATKSGSFRFSIKAHGIDNMEDIHASPFRTVIAVGPAAAAQTSVIGDGYSRLEAGHNANIDLQLRDAYSNTCTHAHTPHTHAVAHARLQVRQRAAGRIGPCGVCSGCTRLWSIGSCGYEGVGWRPVPR